ncbi:tetratricopeptide repeat protein [Pseudanabaena sp. UWO310]|uniref:tetratricopeptide repeat protein n=1 Tax=Pseudanabaena sp. UWO310 TaxID=2480795 RepID=UPI001159FD5D|nr:tetratricopeptide repeat protein [Pseudanabaena sp. UWO310]TYQ30950.1 tetratricopeptide repeat protein [Pseudanabaena sp. UWO310]
MSLINAKINAKVNAKINAKKVLLSSVSLVAVFFGVNVLGAIAQVSERYLSSQEIQDLETQFQISSLGVTGRGVTEYRNPSEISQINDFVNAWQKADSSISPFLGNWAGFEEGLSIYPSTTKGQVCVVETFLGGRDDGIQKRIGVATVLDGRLLVTGESGKKLIVRKKGVLRSGIESEFIAQYSGTNARNTVMAYSLPKPLGTIDSRLTRFGCTTSFPSVSSATNSAASSSIPVKQTDTIAKYPTKEDFITLEKKLQGNPESLVKLRGNQAEQRRKFQEIWKDRNPNAAKFLGAWYTSDRYFYVFPSTVKGGTCVVTQDAIGKLDMQIGVVLNKELRYGGGKGFFWIDRENIVASRDSGSGSLYPIYATMGMPELPESMIGDMERQKCITTLPFEADAQYYKELGDRFVKLGKKEEAISNYRKAVELLRKQNQFTQAKAIEAQILKLGTSDK